MYLQSVEVFERLSKVVEVEHEGVVREVALRQEDLTPDWLQEGVRFQRSALLRLGHYGHLLVSSGVRRGIVGVVVASGRHH